MPWLWGCSICQFHSLPPLVCSFVSHTVQTLMSEPVYTKLAGYGQGSDLSWLCGVMNGRPDVMLCLTSYLVLHISLHLLLFVYIV